MGKDPPGRLIAALGLAALGAVVASAPARWRRADDPTKGRPLVLPPGEELTVERPDGAVLSLWSAGPRSAPTVVLVHGWTADKRVWAATARRLLDSGHRVIAYDQRGHGHSTTGSLPLTVETLGDDLRGVLEHLDLSAVVLAGHSMGGMSVQRLAIAHPDVVAERVAAIVLVSTAACGVVPRGVYGLYRRYARTMAESQWVQRAMADARLGPWLVRSTVGRRPSLAHLEATLETFVSTPVAVRSDYMDSLAVMDLRGGLERIKVPTVVVCGTRDALTPLRQSRRIASLVPGARLRVLPGAGHQLVFEHPEVLAEVIGELSA